MDFSFATYGLGFVAGMLSTLSPCVLPLIPLVVGPALAAHPLGIVALAGGLAVSFTVIGLVVATLGLAIGLDGDTLRSAGAVVMGVLGVVLISQRFQDRFALAMGGVGGAGDRLLRRVSSDGWFGQLLVGVLLGAVWSPCVGPTLGAASLVASQRQHLVEVGTTMLMFGVGAALPILALGWLGRSAMSRWRARLVASGRSGKIVLGLAMIAIAVLVGSGLDKQIEAWLVAISPDWLTDLTTKY